LIRVEASPLIPQELQKLYGYLSGALIETYESFCTLERLYMNEDVVALFNRTGAEFFALVQQLLVNDIILSIARLTDKAKTGTQENWTLSSLVLELSDPKYSELRTRLDEKRKRIEEMSQPVRLYRHKVLAHADRAERLKENTKLGENITISLFRKLLKAFADFLNTFDCEFTNATTDYEDPVHRCEDLTDDLIASLRKAAENH
jgi:AbiU2